MKFLLLIPDEITILYLFLAAVISLFMPPSPVMIYIGLFVSILPLIKKVTYNKLIIFLERIGSGLRVNIALATEHRDKFSSLLDIEGLKNKKEKPKQDYWFNTRKNMSNIFYGDAILMYKNGENVAPIKTVDDKLGDNITFMSEHELEEEAREYERRKSEMQGKKPSAMIFQVLSLALIIITALTVVWGVTSIIESISGLTMTFNDMPNDLITQLGENLVKIVDEAGIVITRVNQTVIESPII